MSDKTEIIKPPKDEVPEIHYVRLFFGDNRLLTLGYRTAEAARAAFDRINDKAHVIEEEDHFGNVLSVPVAALDGVPVLLTSTTRNSALAGAIKLADLQEQKRYAEKLEGNATLWSWLRRAMGAGAIQHPGTEYRQ